MINKVFRLKEAAEVAKDITLPAGQEIQIAKDVVYINGGIVPSNMQMLFYYWIINNPDLFNDVSQKYS